MSKNEINVEKYMVIGAALDDKGAINEMYQFACPKEGDSTFRARTSNFALIREILISALDALDYTEEQYNKTQESNKL